MTGKEAYKIWAAGGKWGNWVRPVQFVLPESDKDDNCNRCRVICFDIPGIIYLEDLQKDTAIFVDRSGYLAVNEGLALSKMGWRPVPLYNGTDEQYKAMALVDNHGIKSALLWGAGVLKSLSFEYDAPPVFLLDSNRLLRYKMSASMYDNSWDLYSQDVPSAEYFLSNGIDKILIAGDKVNRDLRAIFHEFQKKGIVFFFTDGYDEMKEVSIRKPPVWFVR